MQRSNKTLTMTGILLALLVLSGLALLSTQSAPALADVPAGATLAETNKLLVQRAYYEVLSNGNLAVADEIFAPTFQHHVPGFSAIPIGPEGCKLLTMVYHAAFPDLKYTIEDIVAEGDEVVTRWRASGTHEDFFGPQAPSGERITWTGITIHRLADGQIVDEWTSQDTLAFLKQLNAKSFTDVTWGPAYYDDETMVGVAENRGDLGFIKRPGLDEPSGVTWGPAYYADDQLAGPGENLDSVESMKQIDRNALTGKSWGPSYDTAYELVEIETNRESSNFGSRPDPHAGIIFSWGNYYDTADGRLVEMETKSNFFVR